MLYADIVLLNCPRCSYVRMSYSKDLQVRLMGLGPGQLIVVTGSRQLAEGRGG